MGGSLWLALCLLIRNLVKTLFFHNLSKFGRWFSCAQKRLPISKMPCIGSFEIFLIFPNFLRSWVLSRSATREANSHASFDLWWTENLVKYQKCSKYYVHGCSRCFFLASVNLLRWSLLWFKVGKLAVLFDLPINSQFSFWIMFRFHIIYHRAFTYS